MTTEVNRCPACCHASFAELIDFGLVPHSGTFLSQPDEPFTQIQLSFEYCSQCALLRQRPVGRTLGDYTDVSRGTAGQLPAYATYLSESLRLSSGSRDHFVIEVGANDGAFLDILARRGFTNILGVEPSRNCAEACRARGHRVYERHLNAEEAKAIRDDYGSAHAVVCRHTLEHVPDPYSFLQAMRSLLAENGILLLEVPNARAVTHELRGHELWDEHLHIFTPENLAMLSSRAGFATSSILVWPHRDTTNILFWATLQSPLSQEISAPQGCAEDVQLCQGFEPRWRALSRNVAGEVSRGKKPIGMIGASHPQSNYALFTGVSPSIDLVVDDDPRKVGRYVPLPQPVKVLSTAQFLDKQTPATMLRTAFGYEEWMDTLLAPLVATGINVVKPYRIRSVLPELTSTKPV
jgi:SAM-dependent methyltransferase